MLIDLKSLNKAEQNTKEPENQPVLFLSVPECRNLADSETSLRKQIGILEHNVCINFWSYGSFSLHELMFYILQQTGPAHINICTWSISQDAIEKIIRKYQVILVSDENVQDIAETLMISRAALYRHIASLNEKTGTKSRIGLVQFYYRYHRRNEG